MSIFDLFKKSPKKESNPSNVSSAKPWMENPLASPEMQKKRYDAALEFLEIFQERMPLVNGKPHVGTVLSIPARLAGTSLFRVVNGTQEFPAGNVILSEEVNQAYPQLLNLFALYCRQSGVDVMAKPLVATFPENDKSLMTLDQVQAEYQETYNRVMQKHGLDHMEGARAGMVICSIIFQYHCVRSKDIDPYVATGIVAMGVIEGAKTAPAHLGSKPARKAKRFVLGELEAVIQDTRANGGIYTNINPETLKMLKEKNIDPYLVHEKALLNHMEEKIDRLDFVQMDVEAVLKEWNEKPSEQAPIPVRLALWMKKNAALHGYEQNGNSWILKK